MNNMNIFLSFLLSMKWVSIIIVILSYRLLSRYIAVLSQKNDIEINKLIKVTKLNDDTIIDALDKLILDIIDEYVLIELRPRNILYIKSTEEEKIREYVSSEVQKRISDILLRKLEYICNEEYVGELIGKRIYFAILDFTLNYNLNNPEQ